MDHSRLLKFQTGALLIAILSLTACSSSQVDDPNAPPPETAGDVAAAAPDAKTDAVPPVGEDPSLAAQPAPDALDAKTDAPPPGDPGAVADASAPPPSSDPAAAAALDAPASGEVANNTPPATDQTQPAAMTPTVTESGPVGDVAQTSPVADAPAAPVADAPVADAPVVADTSGGVHYKVKHGDTLMKIAFEQYGDLYRWKEIYEANRSHIKDPGNVPPGTELSLNGAGMVTIERNGDQYLIKHGDTLGVISNDVYGTTHKWKKLWENNRQLIKDPNKIYAGFYLYYQPEARMTQDTSAPGGSASNTPQNLPFKNQPAAAVQTAANTVTTPAVQPATTTAPNGARTPASK
jgi:nucleoid-associated protein YgaU